MDHTGGEDSQQGKYFQWILKSEFVISVEGKQQAFVGINMCSVDILHIINLKSQGDLRK